MGIAKKTRNLGQIVEGKAMQTTGKALGNKSLARRGKAELVRGKVKQAMEKGRDSLRH
ncbi:CsbD family protein [Streptomyces sioyaensis]|uniref:CsbD family protein n=1 Tax=Streptomyces sioyaensis TaxID=67364 RepID=A0A4Q1R430_9ACTN|nr:CsbD family protein [Streptomyces sioyaensis]MBM4791614.1 CsbD family protein [Streptomyces sioyaensis]RXS68431.1 CsbD family protein [Streptomyces sioyaensis]